MIVRWIEEGDSSSGSPIEIPSLSGEQENHPSVVFMIALMRLRYSTTTKKTPKNQSQTRIPLV